MSEKKILTPTSVKEKMVSWHLEGKSLKVIADLSGKSRSTAQSILKKWKGTGSIENQWSTGRPSTFTVRDINRLKRIVKSNVGASSNHIIKLFLADNPNTFGRATLYRQLRKFGKKTSEIKGPKKKKKDVCDDGLDNAINRLLVTPESSQGEHRTDS